MYVGLGADYPFTVSTPFGNKTIKLSIPVETMAKDAANAAWPVLQKQIESEAPKLVKQLEPALQAEAPKLIAAMAPEIQKQIPGLLAKIQPAIDAEAKDLKRMALIGVTAICGVVILGALYAGRR